MVNNKNVIEKIRDIEEGIMETLKKLRERIETLETEKADLLKEIEELKKEAERKAETLENEVSSLREEVESLKGLLGYTIEEAKNSCRHYLSSFRMQIKTLLSVTRAETASIAWYNAMFYAPPNPFLEINL